MGTKVESVSPKVNRVLTRVLSPTIRENGFHRVQPRTGWGWHGHCIWVLKIQSVGWKFSLVTGYPPMSLTVETGMFYTFIPTDRQIKLTASGHLLPQEFDCHIRSQLHSTLSQGSVKQSLLNKLESERTDVWWVEPDISNVKEVILNIRDVFLADGVPWFAHYNDLEASYAEVKAERDCLDTYFKAMHFAKHLNRNLEFEHYRQLTKEEESRIRGDMPWFPQLSDL